MNRFVPAAALGQTGPEGLLVTSRPIASFMTKATRKPAGAGPSIAWVLSRRGRLRLYNDHLECGNWNIPYANISKATLTRLRSGFLLPGYLLSLETRDGAFRFGLNGTKYWAGPLPFPVTREQAPFGARGVLRSTLLFTWLALVIWWFFLR